MTIDLIHPTHAAGWHLLAPVAVSKDATSLESRLIIEESNGRYIAAHAEVANRGNAPILLKAIRWTHPEGRRHTLRFPLELEPRYFSTENFRTDFFGSGTCIGKAFESPFPQVTTELGWSEDQTFPGFFIGAKDEPVGLFCAALTQKRFHLLFRLRGRTKADEWYFEIDERPSSTEGVVLLPGETVSGETLFFGLCATNDPQCATVDYESELTRRGVFSRRASNPLPKHRIWCSWNYDFFEKITEEDVLRQLPVLREHFPQVKFVQLDDGYQKCLPGGRRPMIDLLYDTDNPFDPEKFPSGPKGLAEAIRKEGFHPAIWLGLWASDESKMIQENPDWVLRDEMGRMLSFDSKTYGKVSVLDPSLPEVLAYLEHLADTVFGKWGYEGVKLDFSSFAFDGKRNLLRGGLSALECKQRVLEIFRRHLPVDGFFGWCLVAGTGHPLTGGDYFRHAEDIGRGEWPTVQRIALWTVNTHLLMRNRPVLPNIDSIGWSRHFNDLEWESWLNLCAVSGCALEVSGDLAKLPVERLQRISRALDLSNPLRTLRFLDLPQGEITQPPAFWLGEDNDAALLAIFNWSDEPATFSVPPLRFTNRRDAWTGKLMDNSCITLNAHESAIWICS